jgi:hypothetical protein
MIPPSTIPDPPKVNLFFPAKACRRGYQSHLEFFTFSSLPSLEND